MKRPEIPGGLIVGLVALFVSACASGQSVPPVDSCHDGFGEYEQALDAYFQNARGTEPSSIVLRVYGGRLSEYELVVNPRSSRHSIFRYVPKRSIWGNVYSLAKPHRTLDQYITEALKIPFSKTELEIPEVQLQELVTRASHIDTSVCEHFPLKDSKGHEFLPKDGLSFEIITSGGQTRARATDTDRSTITSQNPVLLQWALDLQKAAGIR